MHFIVDAIIVFSEVPMPGVQSPRCHPGALHNSWAGTQDENSAPALLKGNLKIPHLGDCL